MTIVQKVGRILRIGAGVGLAALLVFAPLNFGSTRAGGSTVVALACASATCLWAASLILSRRRPDVPIFVACATAVFVLAALPWISGLASATPATAFTEGHFARVVVRWPFSILSRSPAEALVLLVALVAAILPFVDLARERLWARTFGLTLAGTAVLVAGLALAQNYSGATGIYWRDDGRMPGTFCGTFFHHTSAGAYLNTAWPLAFALTWFAWTREDPTALSRCFAVAGALALIVLFAAHGSHVSRFPQFAALLITPFLILGLGVKIRGLRPWLYGLASVVAIALLVLIGGRTDSIGARWRLLAHPVTIPFIQPAESEWPALMRDDMVIPGTSHSGWFGDRLFGWRAAVDAIAARPMTGHGPGNWMGAASRHTDDPFVRTFYQFLQFAHNDPLQTAVEWGVPAALAVWTLFVGAIVAVFNARLRLRIDTEQFALAVAAACGLVAVLLQAQLDFPLQIPALALNAVVLAALCWAGATRSLSPAPLVA